MQKLTLSVDAHVVGRAKLYAKARGTSVSRLVERFLEMLTEGPATGDAGSRTSPVLDRLRGSLSGGSVSDYRKYLSHKYR
jgi:hypothetical protein